MFQSWVWDQLGTGKDGMMALYMGAFNLAKHRPGAREHYQMKYRAVFPARLGQVMVMVENAVAQRRAELNRSMVEVSAPSRMPSFGQQQGMRGNV